MIRSTVEPIGLMHTWWRGDSLPDLTPLPDLTIAPTDDERLLSALTDLDAAGLRERLAHNHRPWLARLGDKPVGYGWVAMDQAVIPHLGFTLSFRAGDRYLWDFVTLPRWRGQSIYPRILQAVVRSDATADRFWVGHDHANEASRHGIAKAGFQQLATLYRLPDRGYQFVPSGPLDRAAAAASLLGVPLGKPGDIPGAYDG